MGLAEGHVSRGQTEVLFKGVRSRPRVELADDEARPLMKRHFLLLDS